MAERDIVRKIRAYLATIPATFSWKEHGGMYGTAGIPDVICCIRGRFVAFEVKVPGNKPTALQASVHRKIRNAGGIVAVVCSVDDVKSVIKEVLEC